jgi:hypothetical protein
MKKALIFKSIIVLFSIASLISCETEPIDPAIDLNNFINGTSPNNPNTPNPNSILGTYIMTVFNTSVPTDLNGDGTASTNQMNETACFNNNILSLNNNNAFTTTSKGLDIEIVGANSVLTCFTDPSINGTWAQFGTNIIFTYVDSGVTVSDTFVLNGNTLTYTLNGGEIVGLSGGNPVYLTSNISVVYTKQ